MTWEGFYLVCFVVGFALAVIGFLSGTLHWPLGHHLHLPGLHAPHGLGHGVPAHGAGAAHAGAVGETSISPYNFATFMAFLAWFGGMGYLLTSRGNLPGSRWPWALGRCIATEVVIARRAAAARAR